MATEINEVEELTLCDDSKVTVKPLNIRLLRRFMAQIEKMQNLDNDSQAIDVLFVACGISLQGSDRPELGDIFKQDKNGHDTNTVDEEKSQKLEENLTLPLMQRITEVAGGMQSDPNQKMRGLPGKS